MFIMHAYIFILLYDIVDHHTSVLSSSLKHVLQALVRLAGDLTM